MKSTNNGAVIITFNPDPKEIVGNINRICEDFDRVILVDNNSDNLEWTTLITKNNLDILRLSYNLGIARASNIGIINLPSSIDWVVLFDQDSEIVEDYTRKVFKDCEPLYDLRTGILAPEFIIRDKIDYDRLQSCRKVESVIASGAFLSRSMLTNVGLMREDFFIDYVDTEFCLRIRDLGYSIIQSSNTKLSHKLGNMKVYKLLGMSFSSSNHNEIRRYYRSRNRIKVYQIYYRRFPLWVIRDVVRMLTENVKMVLFEKNKISKVFAVLRGTYDGMRGR